MILLPLVFIFCPNIFWAQGLINEYSFKIDKCVNINGKLGFNKNDIAECSKLTNLYLELVTVNGKNLKGLQLEQIHLLNSAFNNSNILSGNFKGGRWYKVDFSSVNFTNSIIHGLESYGTNFRRANFKNAIIRGSIFYYSDFQDCNFQGTKFYDVEFINSPIKGCKYDDTTKLPFSTKTAKKLGMILINDSKKVYK